MTNEEMNKKLETYFLEEGILPGDKLKELVAQIDNGKGITLDKLAQEKGGLSEVEVAKAKTMILGIPYCDVKLFKVNPDALKLLTKEQAIKYCCIAVDFDHHVNSILQVVTDDPMNYIKLDDLRIITGCDVVFFIGTHEAILNKIEECYSESAQKDQKKDDESAPKAMPVKNTESAKGIDRFEINEEWAHSGIVKAGDFCFLSYCVGNVGGTIEEQINGAFDNMEKRLAMVGLTLENVVQMDCLFRDVYNIPVMEKVIKKRFKGKYPARKSIETNFAHVGGQEGLHFQVDAVAYCGRG